MTAMAWKWVDPVATTLVLSGGGSDAVRGAEADPAFKPRPVCFTATIEPVEVEPLLWEGDGA